MTTYRTTTYNGVQQVSVEEALRLLQQGARVELLREDGEPIPVSREDLQLAPRPAREKATVSNERQS